MQIGDKVKLKDDFYDYSSFKRQDIALRNAISSLQGKVFQIDTHTPKLVSFKGIGFFVPMDLVVPFNGKEQR